ncbi:hypothetical protein [Maribacter sp. 2308TA10-17]|uniref:hypothetical protein n=1 Tax=Maribacter sp. 2308TA10-17 TaxID=3386276 RepID=UPI0039BC6494
MQVIYLLPAFDFTPTMLFKLKATFLFLAIAFSANAQIFKTASGSLESIEGIERYNVIFEYAENLEVPKYESEHVFLELYGKKKDKKEVGSGEVFKNLWFSNREKLFEPKFIQEFNFFNLKEKQVTIAKNITDAKYTIVVRTSLIDPGNSNFFFKKDARLEVTIQVYRSDNPNEILYATEMVDVHSRGASKNDYDRIMSAYAELGRGLSKHLSRKT